jgi:hypothetical protein
VKFNFYIINKIEFFILYVYIIDIDTHIYLMPAITVNLPNHDDEIDVKKELKTAFGDNIKIFMRINYYILYMVVGFSIWDAAGCDNKNAQTNMTISNLILVVSIINAIKLFFTLLFKIWYHRGGESVLLLISGITSFITEISSVIFNILGFIILFADNIPCLFAGSGKVMWAFINLVLNLIVQTHLFYTLVVLTELKNIKKNNSDA